METLSYAIGFNVEGIRKKMRNNNVVGTWILEKPWQEKIMGKD